MNIRKITIKDMVVAIVLAEIAMAFFYVYDCFFERSVGNEIAIWQFSLFFGGCIWLCLSVLLFATSSRHGLKNQSRIWLAMVVTTLVYLGAYIANVLINADYMSIRYLGPLGDGFVLGILLLLMILTSLSALGILFYLDKTHANAIGQDKWVGQVVSLSIDYVGIVLGTAILVLALFALGASLVDMVGLDVWDWITYNDFTKFLTMGIWFGISLLPTLFLSSSTKNRQFTLILMCIGVVFSWIYLIAYPFAETKNNILFEFGSTVRLAMAGCLWIGSLLILSTNEQLARKIGWLAAISGLGLVLLSCWGVGLRVQQYGFTLPRLAVLWCLVLSLIAYGALWWKLWRPNQQVWLPCASMMGIALFLFLFFPWLNPFRLSFHSQMNHILAKQKSIQSNELALFGSKGQEALAKLQQQGLVYQPKYRDSEDLEKQWAEFWRNHATFCPKDKELWADFRATWEKANRSLTLLDQVVFYAIDLNHDKQPEIVSLTYRIGRSDQVEFSVHQFKPKHLFSRITTGWLKQPLSYEQAIQCEIKTIPAQYDDVVIGQTKIQLVQ